jgi:hypothetical protein
MHAIIVAAAAAAAAAAGCALTCKQLTEYQQNCLTISTLL